MDLLSPSTQDTLSPVIRNTALLHAAAEGGEYFDSLGGAISHDEFAPFLGGEYRYVSVQIQELFSSVGGQYYIFYMSLGARGHSIDDIVHMLAIKGKIVIALSRDL